MRYHPGPGILPGRAPSAYIGRVTNSYRYRRGDPATIISGRYMGRRGIVESAVYQRTVDRPDGYDAGYHVVIGEGEVMTVRWDQVVGESG